MRGRSVIASVLAAAAGCIPIDQLPPFPDTGPEIETEILVFEIGEEVWAATRAKGDPFPLFGRPLSEIDAVYFGGYACPASALALGPSGVFTQFDPESRLRPDWAWALSDGRWSPSPGPLQVPRYRVTKKKPIPGFDGCGAVASVRKGDRVFLHDGVDQVVAIDTSTGMVDARLTGMLAMGGNTNGLVFVSAEGHVLTGQNTASLTTTATLSVPDSLLSVAVEISDPVIGVALASSRINSPSQLVRIDTGDTSVEERVGSSAFLRRSFSVEVGNGTLMSLESEGLVFHSAAGFTPVQGIPRATASLVLGRDSDAAWASTASGHFVFDGIRFIPAERRCSNVLSQLAETAGSDLTVVLASDFDGTVAIGPECQAITFDQGVASLVSGPDMSAHVVVRGALSDICRRCRPRSPGACSTPAFLLELRRTACGEQISVE